MIFPVLNPAGQNVRQCLGPLPDITRTLPDMSGIFRDHCSVEGTLWNLTHICAALTQKSKSPFIQLYALLYRWVPPTPRGHRPKGGGSLRLYRRVPPQTRAR